ncbi:hypothetical protein BDW62DRAFT_187321 [Aspergillus aurantiobrunneus]
MTKDHVVATRNRRRRPKVRWKPDQSLPAASNPFLIYEYFILWPFSGGVASLVVQRK